MLFHPLLASRLAQRLADHGVPPDDIDRMRFTWAFSDRENQYAHRENHPSHRTNHYFLDPMTCPRSGTADPAPLATRGSEHQVMVTLGINRDDVHLLDVPPQIGKIGLVSIVSSRLGRQLESKTQWYRALRVACAAVASRSKCLLCVQGTAAAPFALRGAELFGASRWIVQPSAVTSLTPWWEQAQRRIDRRLPHAAFSECSPPLKLPPDCRAWLDAVRRRAPRSGLPWRDKLAIAAPDRVIALHCRSKGTLEELLAWRLEQASSAASVRIAVGPGMTDSKVCRRLMTKGAIAWVLFDSHRDGIENHPPEGESTWLNLSRISSCGKGIAATTSQPVHSAILGNRKRGRVIEVPDHAGWNFLTHCTRRREGPWPGQSRNSYLDDLILHRDGADHGPLAVLWHILESGRLLASAEGIRGGTPVVCWSAVPIGELSRLRVFRPHRGRWDFEPYGICIRRSALAALGAREVQYAADDTWQRMNAADRPFYQVEQSLTRGGNLLIWREEQEWRHVGDVDLRHFAADDLFAFVPTQEEADRIVRDTGYCVSVLPSDDGID